MNRLLFCIALTVMLLAGFQTLRAQTIVDSIRDFGQVQIGSYRDDSSIYFTNGGPDTTIIYWQSIPPPFYWLDSNTTYGGYKALAIPSNETVALHWRFRPTVPGLDSLTISMIGSPGFIYYHFKGVGVGQSGVSLGTDPKLELSWFPNPAKNSGSISYHLDNSGHVSLQLFDIKGTAMKTLLDENEAEGDHQQLTSLSDLPSGGYILCMTLTANGNTSIVSRPISIER